MIQHNPYNTWLSCKGRAIWMKLGKRKVLRCPTTIGQHAYSFMMEYLGAVKRKNNGRYEYTLYRNKGSSGNWWVGHKTLQGVKNTEEEAIAFVESFLV